MPQDNNSFNKANLNAWKWQLIAMSVLLLLLAGTTLLKQRQLRLAESDTSRQQARIVENALDKIQDDLAKIQEDLLQEAESIASRSDIVEALDLYVRTNDPASLQRLIRYFVNYKNKERGSVELYTAAPRLVAWKGFSMPTGDMYLTEEFLDTAHIEAIDDGVRQAFVAWQPVTIDGQVIGAVRAVHLIGAKMPVENEFLQSYSLSERWNRLTRLPVQAWVQRQVSLPETVHSEGRLSPIIDIEGHTLGSVYIAFPRAEELRMAIEERYSDIQILWLTLLFFLMAFLCFQVFRTQSFVYEKTVGKPGFLQATLHFSVLSLLLVGLRYALLVLDVPARWQRGKAPLAPLFDPSHFASDFGAGVMRSMGDMFTTTVVAALIAALLLRYARQIGRVLKEKQSDMPLPVRLAVVVTIAFGTSLIIAFLTHVLALFVHHAVLDSTLDYFARTGLMPDRLVFFVFFTMMLATISIMTMALGIVWLASQVILYSWPALWPRTRLWAITCSIGLLSQLLYFGYLVTSFSVPWAVWIGFFVASWGIIIFVCERPEGIKEWMHFRAALLGILLLTLPLYLLLYQGMDIQLRNRMVESAGSFDTGRDPRVIFAIEQVLNDANEYTDLHDELVLKSAGTINRAQMDTLAETLYRGSSLASLVTYDVSLTFFDSTESPVGRFMEEEPDDRLRTLDNEDALEFLLLKSMFVESGSDSLLVEQVTGRREPDRFQYEGLGPIFHPESQQQVGWVMARVEPKTLLRDEGKLFPKVLLPTGVNQLRGNLSLAEFQDQVLLRTFGSDFGRYRMEEHVFDALKSRTEFWQTEETGDKEYLTYYRRKTRAQFSESVTQAAPASTTIIAVRSSLINLFDHLYYLLRMTVAGLLLGGPLYLIVRLWWLKGRSWRRSKFKFKDKVLNAFLLVGMLAVAIVGVIGLRVVTAENEEAIESWIKEHLNRVEESLAFQADFGELPSGTLARVNVNALSNQVGLDLNVYQDKVLVKTSREQLIRDRLIDERLPIEAYYALNYGGARHAFIPERVGSFEYMAGYRVLSDRNGEPAFVISVPTLPEQERIKEERARTVAYLFGALLLLMVTIMLTASLLANALTRPIGRLRQGLQAVARGRFEQALPVGTRDEIGELVQTFNEMQEQLSDSRRKLAQQERQLAWREMARQVAHEIKNPLTPMKLSVQHLRRAFQSLDGDESTPSEKDTRFNSLFERITTTLIEQVDALARIANEFSSFARLPKRILEPLDLNVVLSEAVSLMQEQVDADISTTLHHKALVLEADREELRRIYINLIKNAIEATQDEKASKVRVTTSLQYEEEHNVAWAYSTVSDEGSGIAKEVRNRIFEPNFSSKTSGTGLGLAIVKKGIEDLRGEIGFDTEENVGTTFWIRLPLVDDEK
ncbi:MAG: ATP-binding protein [Rhodothermales bacterium]